MRAALILLLAIAGQGDDVLPQTGPWILRVEPLGATRGTTVTVEFNGERFGKLEGAWFDTLDLQWKETIEASDKRIAGRISIAPGTTLGPHLIHLRTANGRTNTRLFNVLQFPLVAEVEQNGAQEIELRPQVINGYLKQGRDIDLYRFSAKAGERWSFDLRSLEYGSHLECEMALTDDAGRVVAFNDDRDDYLETPLIEHRFSKDGFYRIKLDQYRGPQGVDCAQNCGYLLQISQLPLVLSADPMGLRPGVATRVHVQGKRLDEIQQAWLSPVRAGENYRLTFPFTIPLRLGADRAIRVEGRILRRAEDGADVEFTVPSDGLWRLWVSSPNGIADGISFDASDAIDGRLGTEVSYPIEGVAGKPMHAWTLAAQLGLPRIDTVLSLYDGQGKLLAENDDLMTGQGTVIGNPDSSLYYTPTTSERLRLTVRDRTGRGGAEFVYRLHIANESPGFRLITEPEEFRGVRGEIAELSVLLIPDPGFHEAVDTWLEGAEATRGQFRSDQHFGPSGDGDNVNIPETILKVQIPRELPVGEYPIRVFGRRASGGPVVEAFTTLWIGAPRKRNDIRRPLPAVTMTVISPAPGTP